MLIRFRVLINHKVSNIVPVGKTIHNTAVVVQPILLNQLDTELACTGVVLYRLLVRDPCVVRVAYSLRLYTNYLSLQVTASESPVIKRVRWRTTTHEVLVTAVFCVCRYPLSVPTVRVLPVVIIVIHPLVVPFHVITTVITNVSITTAIVLVAINSNGIATAVGILVACVPVNRVGSNVVVTTLIQVYAVTASRRDITCVRTLTTARRCLQRIIEPQLACLACIDVHNVTGHSSLCLR